MLRVKLVIWGLEMSQAAAKSVLKSLSSFDEELIEKKARAVELANRKSGMIAAEAVIKQQVVNSRLKKKKESIQKQEMASAMQTMLLEEKIS